MGDMKLVVAFHRWQTEGRMHPFTCGTDGCGSDLSIVDDADGVRFVCPVCEYVQTVTDDYAEMILGYAEHEYRCLRCQQPVEAGDGPIHTSCLPKPRCVRCGQYSSICGHSLPFTERIKHIRVDRTSLR